MKILEDKILKIPQAAKIYRSYVEPGILLFVNTVFKLEIISQAIVFKNYLIRKIVKTIGYFGIIQVNFVPSRSTNATDSPRNE